MHNMQLWDEHDTKWQMQSNFILQRDSYKLTDSYKPKVNTLDI